MNTSEMKESTRVGRSGILWLVAAVVATTPTSWGQIDAAVPCPDGAAPVVMCYGQHANCAINFAADLDQFRFLGTAGDNVRISVAGTSNNLDPEFHIRDSSNMTVFNPTHCNAGCCNACIVTGVFDVLTTDFYTIFVNDFGDTNGGNYTLHLERILPLYPTASLSYGASPLTATLGHQGDHDFVTFEGEAGSDINLHVNGATNNLDPKVEIYDPNGVSLVITPDLCTSGCCNVCNFTVNIPSLPIDGTYTVLLSDDFLTNGGNVRLSVQCLFSPSGSCPGALVDGPLGTNYCTSSPNSTGNPGLMSAFGTTSITENRIFLTGNDLPIGENGIFFSSMVQMPTGTPLPPPSLGLLCMGSPISRFQVNMTCSPGQVDGRVDFGNLPFGMTGLPGQTWNFQFWHRDGPVNNTTDALAITFTP